MKAVREDGFLFLGILSILHLANKTGNKKIQKEEILHDITSDEIPERELTKGCLNAIVTYD